jgi:hypothetical protein
MADAAHGCSCARASLQEQLDQAEFVAMVRIESTTVNPEWVAAIGEEYLDFSVQPLSAKFTMLETLKGDGGAVQQLSSGYGGGDCGVPLVPGFDVLVAGRSEAGGLIVTICSASRIIGLRSLLEGKATSALNSANEAYIESVRSYLLEGAPLHECASFDFSPWDDAEQNGEMEERCREWLEAQSSDIQGED